MRKYQLDETFFDEIDTEEKAYFLGLMDADGCNGGVKRNIISIYLHGRDVKILEAFRSALKSNYPLYHSNRQNAIGIQFRSTYMCNRLTQLGCVPRKSFTLTFPEWMPDNLLPHFIRGYIDGDGWICLTAKDRHSIVGACGSIPFITKLAEVIGGHCNVHAGVSPNSKTPGILEIKVQGRGQVQAVLAWLYKDATIFLERKRRVANRILIPTIATPYKVGSELKSAKLAESDVLKIKDLLTSGIKLIDIANQFDVAISRIRDISYGVTWGHVTGWSRQNNARRGKAAGIKNGKTRLLPEDIDEIRSMLNQKITKKIIASRFQVSINTIYNAINEKTSLSKRMV